MSFVDFAEVKARCSIEQAAKFLGLKTSEERFQLQAPCPACGNGGPRAIVITPSKGLFHCFPSKVGGDQIALVSHVKGVSQKEAAALMLGQTAPGTSSITSTVQNGTSTRTVQDKFPPLDYLEHDHVTVEALGLSQKTAEALGIGYAPKGMMKGYVAIPIRLSTGELTGYIGITEAKLPKEFHLSNVATFPKKSAKKEPPRECGFLYYLLKPEPEPVGVSVEPLGEALGPRVFPDGLWVLLGEVTEAPAVPVVLPFDVEPVALPVAAEPAEVPPEAPLDEAPPACASAKVLESAKAVASAIVVSFMVVSLG